MDGWLNRFVFMLTLCFALTLTNHFVKLNIFNIIQRRLWLMLINPCRLNYLQQRCFHRSWTKIGSVWDLNSLFLFFLFLNTVCILLYQEAFSRVTGMYRWNKRTNETGTKWDHSATNHIHKLSHILVTILIGDFPTMWIFVIYFNCIFVFFALFEIELHYQSFNHCTCHTIRLFRFQVKFLFKCDCDPVYKCNCLYSKL